MEFGSIIFLKIDIYVSYNYLLSSYFFQHNSHDIFVYNDLY